MENLTSISSSLLIVKNNALFNLIGLDSLTYVGGNLSIGLPQFGGNNSLLSVSGLGNLRKIGGSLHISRNQTLANVDALSSLDSIGGDIDIFNNHELLSITGLENISDRSIINLSIQENNKLSDCAVQSICDYLVSPNGAVIIENNKTGCDSREEVEEACKILTIDENTLVRNFTVHPNPAKSISHFRFRVTQYQRIKLEILDVYGKKFQCWRMISIMLVNR